VKNMNPRVSRTQCAALALALPLAIGLYGCGKSVNMGELFGSVPPPQVTLPPTGALPCGSGQMAEWDFVQPDAVSKRVVDLLFVVDTSASMYPKRARIADTIPAFIAQLTPDTDYRIGVMLAHGGASAYSGRLYSAPGVPLVLSSKVLSSTTIQKDLRLTLANVTNDVDEANGEASLYSLMRSFGSDRVAEIQRQGFYRSDAALSVVFVTDENDICYPPQANGYTAFPDYTVNPDGIEAVAFQKYCTFPGQTATNIPGAAYSQVLSFKGTQPVSFAGITHVDPALVPKGAGLEDSIGHGIIELVSRSPSGVLIDISQSSYATGLAQLGGVVSTQLDLLTRFGLNGSQAIHPDSIRVSVDNKPVPAAFDPGSRTVEIAPSNAGASKSVIKVQACLVATG
jgi:hypothetical protein